MIHRGELVLKVITQNNVNKSKLAEKIGISRTQLYNLLDSADMSYYYIKRIGDIIDYDFGKLMPHYKSEVEQVSVLEEPMPEYKKSEGIEMKVNIDGDDEKLDRLFIKLKALNETLKNL